ASAAVQSATYGVRKICSGSRVGCSLVGDTPAATAISRITLWRSCRSGRPEIKLHWGWLFRTRLCSENWARRKTEHACDQICRKTAHCHVVVLHRSVEVAAFDRNSIVIAFQLLLQLHTMLI